MPELPEVEHGRRLAERTLAGQRLRRVVCAPDTIVCADDDPETIEETLRGATVRGVERRGKWIVFRTDRDRDLLVHFGMTGGFRRPGEDGLRLESGPADDPDWPPRFTKLELETDAGTQLAFTNARRLGRLLLRGNADDEEPLRSLGPDLLESPPTAQQFRTAIASRKPAIKTLLLDQTMLAGVGNWIADEALYQAGIAPHRRASDLDGEETDRLLRSLKRIVRRAVDVDANAQRLPATWLFHRRWGKQEGVRTRDGHPIVHATIGGRTTAWVPTKQR